MGHCHTLRGIKAASALVCLCLVTRSVSWTVTCPHTWRTQTSAWRTSRASCSSNSSRDKQPWASWITSKTLTHTYWWHNILMLLLWVQAFFIPIRAIQRMCKWTQTLLCTCSSVYNYVSHQQMVLLYCLFFSLQVSDFNLLILQKQ